MPLEGGEETPGGGAGAGSRRDLIGPEYVLDAHGRVV